MALATPPGPHEPTVPQPATLDAVSGRSASAHRPDGTEVGHHLAAASEAAVESAVLAVAGEREVPPADRPGDDDRAVRPDDDCIAHALGTKVCQQLSGPTEAFIAAAILQEAPERELGVTRSHARAGRDELAISLHRDRRHVSNAVACHAAAAPAQVELAVGAIADECAVSG